MNKTVPNAKNWPEKKKRAKLRAIDRGTYYDIVGRMKRLTRQIENGDLGDVDNIVLAIQFRRKDDETDHERRKIELYGFGCGPREMHHFMASRLANRLIG